MTDREMRIMEDHTRALQANTRAMQELIPLLQVFASKKFVDMMANNADTVMGAARKIENAVLQADTNQAGYAWLDIKTLNTAPLYPSKLRRQIMNLFEGKEYKVYLGNEEIDRSVFGADRGSVLCCLRQHRR